MVWEVIGFCAATLTMFGFIPQIIKMVRTKHVKDVSLIMMFQVGTGIFLWLLYGIHLKNFIIIMANAVNLTTIIIAILCYFYYLNLNRGLG